MKKANIIIILFLSTLPLLNRLNAQCGINVPTYTIDLTGAPDSTWTLLEQDALDRQGQCCGAPTNENCISFEITLDANCAGIFFDYDGAGAFGSLDWQIDCGPEYNLKDTICIAGPGSYTLTFCKPGTDNGNYTLTSVPKPTFPDDQTVPMNCVQPVEVLGVQPDQITWQSISPGNPGDYDYMLTCTDCLTPTFLPDPSDPTVIEYKVCGYPLLDYCVGAFTFCDTVQFTVQDSLKVFTSPTNATFCAGGSATINASATGGDGNYSFLWYNSSLTQIGSGSSFTTSTPGTYTVEVRDGNYEPGSCDEFFKTFSVSETQPPVVDAGADQVLCANSPNAIISGSIQNATGGIWSGGSGNYLPSNTNLNITYEPTQAEIANGSVTLTLSSTGVGGGCTDASDDITLFFVDTLKTDLVDQNLNCSYSSTLVSPNVTGGLAPIQYVWSDGTTGSSSNFGAGTHCLTLTDANGCTTTDCFTITTPPALTISMSSNPATTVGGTDGSASTTIAGGSTPYNYNWSSGGTSATENGLGYGVYTVIVTDDNGCQINGSVVVNDPACNGFEVNTTATDVNCFGGNDGQAEAIVTGGTSPFNFTWDDPLAQTSSTASGLSAGVYTIEVTDDNGCIAIANATINEPSVLQNTFTHSDVTIQGGNNGSAQANPSGGTGAYSFNWSTGSVNASVTNLSEGWYYVDITDANSCALNDSIYISEPPCNNFEAVVGTTPVQCNGQSNGAAVVNVVNGVGPYSINWSTGVSGSTSISGLPADIYTVEVTDAQNCYAFATFGIVEPSPLSVGLVATPSTCYGKNNGTIDVTVSGGTFPSYSFLWSNNTTNEDRINLAPGAYSVTVTDGNGCTANGSATITQPDTLEVTYVSTDVTCYEGTDGAIDLSVQGGTQPYAYSWSNGSTTEDLTGIDVGGYILNLIDANFCTTPEAINIAISQPEEVIADSIIPGCTPPGTTNTPLVVYPNGGTSDYSISYNGGSTFETIGTYTTQLTAGGSFDIQIKDINNCLSPIYTIDIDTNVYANAINYNLCYTAPQVDETVTITPAGGAGNYQVSYDNGVSFEPIGDFANLLGINNSYLIVIKDSNDCYSETYTIELPDTLSVDLNITSDFNGEDISCFGANDGAIQSIASGGAESYTYNWNTGATTASISNLTAGNYIVTVTDTNNCQTTGNITLTQPTLVTSMTQVVSNYNGEQISCNGGSDGQASVSPNGGTMPYTYLWSNSQTTATATGLPAGTHTILITDVNGCENSNSVFITDPDTLGVTTSITDVSCNGGNDGAIDATPSGGVAPYTYLWNNGATTEDISNIPAGNYQVSLTDANGCLYVLGQIVVDPTAIDLDLEMTDALCKGDQNGAADLSVAGGTPPYTYQWNNSETTEDLTNIGAGTYTVIVTDFNGCFTSIFGEVSEPDTLSITTAITDASCYGYSDGELSIIASGGTTPYSYYWSNGDTTATTSDLSQNWYLFDVVDANNCIYTDSLFIDHPDSLWATLDAPLNYHGHHITYPEGSDGSINLEVFGGTTPYSFLWSNEDTEQNISGLSSGNYSVIITDDQGCTYTISTTLEEPFALEIPTGITPNNDGHNDFLYIRGLEVYPDSKVTIINQWGNVVFTVDDYQNDWRGTNQKGNDLPDGTYFVVLEVSNGEKISSYLDVRRK